MLPYSLTSIERNNHAYGLNKVGLERRGFTPAQIKQLRAGLPSAAGLQAQHHRRARRHPRNTRRIRQSADTEHVAYLADFIANSHRGIIK